MSPEGGQIEQRLRRLFSAHRTTADAAPTPPAREPRPAPVLPKHVADLPLRLSQADDALPEAATDTVHVVRFSLGEVEFAVPLTELHEIQQLPTVTPMPNCGAHVLGLVNLRGNVVPVFDVRAWLPIAPAPPASDAHMLVFEVEGQLIAVLVDTVHGPGHVPHPFRAPPPEWRSDLIAGMVEQDGSVIIVLQLRELTRRGAVSA